MEDQTTFSENQQALLKRLTNLSLYNHNAILKTNIDNLSFKSVFNCKKMNRQYSIVSKIQGDFHSRNVQISCMLLSFGKLVIGKWNYQKLQLVRFADKYNSQIQGQIKQQDNYQIKVNPVSGQFYVSLTFTLNSDMIKDMTTFQQKMTDQCGKVGRQSEKIFNTILELIFLQQANEPYLKLDERAGVHYPKPLKLHKLFNQIKKMNAMSSYFKIKQDISAQNKLRSVFIKLYLKKTQRTINVPQIIDNAVIYNPKFSSRHVEALSDATSQAKKKTQMIIPFQFIQDRIQIDIAKNLNQNLSQKRPNCLLQLPINPNQSAELINQLGIHNITIQNINLSLFVELDDPNLINYEHLILQKIGRKHPNMIQYYALPQTKQVRITEFFQCMKLQAYLTKFAKNISLIDKINIMTQICRIMEYLHKQDVGYFIDLNDIYITGQRIIKIKNFINAYSVMCWDQEKSQKIFQNPIIMPNVDLYKTVVGYRGDEPGYKDKPKDESIIKKLENQRSDVFCLGMVLYRILMQKFPFHPNAISILYKMGESKIQQFLNQIWTLETQFFLRQGGMIAKLLGQLLLKCFHMDCSKRPFVECLLVIISQVQSKLSTLY